MVIFTTYVKLILYETLFLIIFVSLKNNLKKYTNSCCQEYKVMIGKNCTQSGLFPHIVNFTTKIFIKSHSFYAARHHSILMAEADNIIFDKHNIVILDIC